MEPLAINAAVAGYAFEKSDVFLGRLGNPIGLPVYKPVNSSGEPFLPAYLGMIGIPVDLIPTFPENANTVLLTQASSFDPDLIDKMKRHLTSGSNLVITSGLLNVLKGNGIEEITTISSSDAKIVANAYSDLGFNGIYNASESAVFPRIDFPTNDAWMEVTAISGDNSYPLITQSEYGGGLLRVLTVPDDVADLYKIPQGTLSLVRDLVLDNMPVNLDAPPKVSLFLYDNNTCIVHSFLPHKTRIQLTFEGEDHQVTDLLHGVEMECGNSHGKTVLEGILKPYDYWVLSWE